MKIKHLITNGIIGGSILLSGCSGYYESQTAYYMAQSDSAKAYLKAMESPIAEMVAPDGTRFVVNRTEVHIPVIKETTNPVVDGIKTVVNSTPAAILSGAALANQILSNSVGSTTTTTNDSNNKTLTSTPITTSNTTSTVDNHSNTSSITNSNNPITTDNHEISNPVPIIK